MFLKRDSNLGLSRIAIFEDCRATALTTQPTWLDSFSEFTMNRIDILSLKNVHTKVKMYFCQSLVKVKSLSPLRVKS